ncbi:MAG: PTS system mannose/fructose/sorbose family transporter subunit IID [Longimicrobiales bacterium]
MTTRLRAAVLLRCYTIQGSWNYRTMIGTGFAFALLPVLRLIYGDDTVALRRAAHRHAQLFNSHPYIAPLAVGAVARLEQDGESVEVIERFKLAVRGSLGSLGDRLIWAGWRPVCLLLALSAYFMGASGWLAAVLFLVLYNVVHVGLRTWSFRVGFAAGKTVGERLRASRVVPAQRALNVLGLFVCGLILPLAATAQPLDTMLDARWSLGAIAAVIAGVSLGAAARRTFALFLVLFAIGGLLIGLVE